MPRGAEYDPNPNTRGVPLSDNAIDPGKSEVHGSGATDAELNRTHKAAPLPEQTGRNELHSGQGATGSGSGKGGHEPKTTGENKGLGAHKSDGTDVQR
ncbi:hypothetical protein PHISCL_03329 [Aspergillus sclerotialis]|uniref:Uncharacterized protein n=1 Tax=Aspergillus sclerotialis TaxID=2070753 RepID=A0A3A2ZYA2_9EURO|nr:hypothetical protein PHISCL_03329 [Aspergillus sclerotialis]